MMTKTVMETASTATYSSIETIVSSVAVSSSTSSSVAAATPAPPAAATVVPSIFADTTVHQAVAAATAAADSSSSPSSSFWVFPLVLSCMAGMSTCLGAAVVFCFPPDTIKKTMPFSLSLAASVMITISAVSIAPECLDHVVSITPTTPTTTTLHNNPAQQDPSALSSILQEALLLVPNNNNNNNVIIDYALLLERVLSFGLGCVAYIMLSKILQGLPDPESLEFFGGILGGGGSNNDSIVGKYDDNVNDNNTTMDNNSATSTGHLTVIHDVETHEDLVGIGTSSSLTVNHRTISSSSSDEEDGVGGRRGRVVEDHETNHSFVSYNNNHTETMIPASSSSSGTALRSSSSRLGTAQQRMNTTSSTTTRTSMQGVSSPASANNNKANKHGTGRSTNDNDIIDATEETYDNCKPTTTGTTLLSSSTTAVLSETTSNGTTTMTPSISRLKKEEQRRSWRVALLLFVSLLAHNFPEGLAVAASAQESPQLGVTVAIGILIHNVVSINCILFPVPGSRFAYGNNKRTKGCACGPVPVTYYCAPSCPVVTCICTISRLDAMLCPGLFCRFV